VHADNMGAGTHGGIVAAHDPQRLVLREDIWVYETFEPVRPGNPIIIDGEFNQTSYLAADFRICGFPDAEDPDYWDVACPVMLIQGDTGPAVKQGVLRLGYTLKPLKEKTGRIFKKNVRLGVLLFLASVSGFLIIFLRIVYVQKNM